jgi:hypothetical protein
MTPQYREQIILGRHSQLPCAQDGWMDEVEAARSKPRGERQNSDLLELQMSSMRKGWMSNPLEAVSETSPANENI